ALLRDQLLLAPGELHLGLQLVLLDGTLLLHRVRAAGEGGLVALLLDQLAGGSLQRALEIRGRLDRRDADRDQLQAEVLQRALLTEGELDLVAQRGWSLRQNSPERDAGHPGPRTLLGDLREEQGELLQGLSEQHAFFQIDREVDP